MGFSKRLRSKSSAKAPAFPSCKWTDSLIVFIRTCIPDVDNGQGREDGHEGDCVELAVDALGSEASFVVRRRPALYSEVDDEATWPSANARQHQSDGREELVEQKDHAFGGRVAQQFVGRVATPGKESSHQCEQYLFHGARANGAQCVQPRLGKRGGLDCCVLELVAA
jgi:hypothetical protein